MLALIYGKEHLQLYLLVRTNVNHIDNNRQNALLVSLEHKNSEEVRLLLIEWTINLDHIDNSGLNALMLSLKHNSSEKVQLALLERTTNIDQVDRDLKDSLTYSLEYKVSLLVILELIKKAKVTGSHIDLAIKNNHGILVFNALINKLANQGC